ncbi:TPA: recombinase family protein [Legionella pneumophila]|uniref:Transposase (Resolvase, DNA invertase) n=1 Tax=Legionella jamestowniensis TaxID=455 RepID=A0A0W0UKF9_9GAMM|nr:MULTISPECIES: recombinase family protein [Legionella]HAT8850028.1 helix-turn-helix domain-containing protein [Legionella pneumophila subsp. pneumophila]KTD08398.1 transposase (resolvase, DNA invertase) [Legionella jamestowniensis]CZI71354.1 DNA-invertase hin [Legionella pneumophila]CZI71585.1 DNA-invertase hin [Legionella pneumophila]CZP34948.1 DNA-invertase hin [Legionella pneumophila]
MKIGYVRIFKAEDRQLLKLQIDSLIKYGVERVNIYQDLVSDKSEYFPGLDACLRALHKGDILVVWKLDRLARDLNHLINIVQDISAQGGDFKVLTGSKAIDTSKDSGKFIFYIFAALAEFEQEVIQEQKIIGLKLARARGKNGGRKFLLTKEQVTLAQESMQQKDTNVSTLCKELGISKQTLYRYISPEGNLREYGKNVLGV